MNKRASSDRKRSRPGSTKPGRSAASGRFVPLQGQRTSRPDAKAIERVIDVFIDRYGPGLEELAKH